MSFIEPVTVGVYFNQKFGSNDLISPYPDNQIQNEMFGYLC